MKSDSTRGGAPFQVLMFILLIASVALNVAFFFDFDALAALRAPRDVKDQGAPVALQSETSCLREIAGKLGISVSDDKTPGDIAFDISRCLEKTTAYGGQVLSDESLSDCKDAILNANARRVVEEYHSFVQKVYKKRILILNIGK